MITSTEISHAITRNMNIKTRSKVKSTEADAHRFKIVSWNIHDASDQVLGNKTSQEEFLSVIEKSSIFFLQETKQIINIPNFICFNSNRDQSRSGGVCLGIHRSIENDVKLLTTNDSDITAIRIT